MAQVLAPILQTSGSITMIHSSSDAFQNTQVPQPHHQQQRSSQMPRSQTYNAQNGGAGYRGTSTPIAPYAFSSTPQLRQENRSTSAPNPQALPQANPARLGHPSHPSSSSDSTVSTSGSSSRSIAVPQVASKDDSLVGMGENKKSPLDGFLSSPTIPDLSLSLQETPNPPASKSSPAAPGRYRRTGGGRTESSGSITPTSTPTPTQQSPSIGTPAASATPKATNVSTTTTSDAQSPTRPGHNRASSVDDMQATRQGASDPAKRYRRRSLSGIDAAAQATEPITTVSTASPTKRPTQELRPPSNTSRPNSSQGHERQGSAGSVSSTGSHRPVSSRAESSTSVRGAPETSKRVLNPSPLSQPISPAESPSPAKKAADSTAAAPSPALQHLTALNDKEASRGMKSRLRRAFSFGSAAELRRASAQNNFSAERAKLRKDLNQSEEDAEQAAIVAKQEAAGIGAGIYNGQGGFSGSNDNLSISSTASSASIMLRKMGHGMKKGGRSIKGLFRPKSVIGVPAADGPVVQASVGQVSMVTVEAERQKVNVNADPREQIGGGTGYPRLERNSLDAGRTTNDHVGSSGSPLNEGSRKSIVGGDRERAEVLSSIKKGILKRTDTSSGASSPVARPVDLPLNETPKSSAPSTPNSDHVRPVQVHVSNDDYFGRGPRVHSNSTRSLPNTPQGHPRNISFSPRLQFHDAWSSADYDRRGDIATCNRLTPMLAQQIKEELNTFKMEMEVHELSKPHTHFF